MADFKEQIVIDATSKGFQNVERQLDKLSKSLKNVGDRFTSVGRSLSLRLTAPLIALGGIALKQAADLEQLEVALQGLTGGAENAEKTLQSLIDFTAKTPFQLNQVAAAGRTLLSFGVATTELQDQLKTLGDIAAGSNSSLNELSLIYGKVLAAGQLTGETFLQFAERGIPLNKELSNVLGVQESQIKSLISEGKIGLPQVNEAFQNLTTGAGQFANQLEKQSKTLAGAFSTLKDNINLTLVDIGRDIEQTFDLTEVINKITDFTQQIRDRFRSLSDDVKQRIIVITLAVATIGPALITLGLLLKAFALFATPIGAFVATLGLLVAAVVAVTSGIKFLIERFEFVSRIISFVNGITLGLTSIFAQFAEVVVIVVRGFTELGALIDVITGKETALTRFRNSIKSIETAIVDLKANLAGASQDEFANAFADEVRRTEIITVDDLIPDIPLFNEEGKKAGKALGTGIGEGLDEDIKEEGKIDSTAQFISSSFADAFVSIGDRTKGVAQAFSDLAQSIIRSLTQQALTRAIGSLLFGAPQELSGGGRVGGFASGGFVSGEGTSTSDSIPAFLSNGEYVLNARSVKNVGVGFLNALNGMKSGFKTKGGFGAFANGGEVSGDSGVVLNVINNSSQPVSANADIRTRGRQIIIDTVLEDLSNNGVFSQQLQNTYGVRR